MSANNKLLVGGPKLVLGPHGPGSADRSAMYRVLVEQRVGYRHKRPRRSDPGSAVLLESDLQIDPEPEAISAARHYLEDLLEDSMPPQILENIRLLTSELLTNSVRHAGLDPEERIRLRVVASAGRVCVEVRDGGPGFEKPSPRTPGPEQESGWGLYLLERLADRWGVERNDLCCVWFEIEYGAVPPA